MIFRRGDPDKSKNHAKDVKKMQIRLGAQELGFAVH
jgi:hypothetical protein